MKALRWLGHALRWLGPFLLVLLAAYFFVLDDRLDELDLARATIDRMKVQYLDKKKLAVNLDLHREQRREAEAVLGKLVTALPNRIDRQFEAMQRAARARHLRIDELLPDADEQFRDFYAELAARVRLTGRYHDLGAFAADLGSAPGSLQLRDLSLDAASAGLVTMTATLRSYRYLDDEEVAAQRKKNRARSSKK